MTSTSFIVPSSPLDRRSLGKYEVLCRLSTGGMSEIYLAHQKGLAGFNKLVVLKTILPNIGGEVEFVRMFLEEARTTAAFSHPNIAQVYELDTDEGRLFMAMEFVQGCTLVEMARACRQAKEAIPIGFTLSSVRDTALALHYAHTFTDPRGRRQIVIHRDVAEKNIMVTYEGVTKLLDFGIAKALGRTGQTTIGMVKGTSGYMSPEQIRGEPLDPRSDIFSLGVVVHECLTGLRLFHGKSAEEGMKAALRDTVVPPSKWNPKVPPEIDALVLRALQRDRGERFATALEFAREIERLGSGLLWHTEQSGELVARHFLERRAETRRVLESAMGQEQTGEYRVKALMDQVRAGAAGQQVTGARGSTPSLVPAYSPPTIAPVTPARATQNQPPAPRQDPRSTPPRATPARLTQNPAEVHGADPHSTPPIPIPSHLAPAPAALPHSDIEVKTVPAAALPEGLRALRARLLAQSQSGEVAKESSATHGKAPPRQSRPAPVPLEPRPVPPPPQSTDAHMLSITAKMSRSSTGGEEKEDDDEVRTTISRPEEVLGAIARASGKPSSAEVLHEVREEAGGESDDEAEEQAGDGKGFALALLLIALALLASAGLLVLFDVIPVP